MQWNASADWGGGDVQHSAEAVIGGAPAGAGLQLWLTRSPGFNLEKVAAPLLVTAQHSPSSLVLEWGTYGALRSLNKPVDIVWMRNAPHVLVKPSERLYSQQQAVDWFRFWLQDYEDPDSAKAEQYQRWHELRKLQIAQDAERASASRKPLKVH